MTQSTNESVESASVGADNGEARSNNRALMVREYEMNALSPYMSAGPGAMYLDGAPTRASFSQLLHALRRRWLLALITGLIVSLPLAALVWLITPENYEVVAWLRVGDPPQTSPGSSWNIRPGEYEQYRKTQAARIKSPQVLLAALRQEGISELPMVRGQGEPLKFLEEELVVVTPVESEVLQIKMRGKDARQLVKIVNAVKDSYLENEVNAERARATKKFQMYSDRHKEKSDEISNKQQRLAALQKSTNSPDLEQMKFNYQSLLTRLNFLQQQQKEVRGYLLAVETKLATIKERQEKGITPPENLIQSIMSRDDQIAELTQSLSRIKAAVEYEMSVSKLGTRDPAVVRLQSSIEGINNRLAERRAEIRPLIIKQIESELFKEGGDNMGDPDLLEVRRKELMKELANLENNYNDIQIEVAKLDNQTGTLRALEGEIKEAEEYRARLTSQMEDARMVLEYEARVQLIEPASEPEGTEYLFRYFVTIIAGIFGLLLGGGAIVAMEYQAHRLNTSGELSSNLGLRVLGTVPNLETLSRSKGLNGSAALQGILAESVDSIRTILLQQARDDAPHVIMVTSAGDREGKTTVASHLAASLARSGRRTLLVDGDLRSPTAHAMFSAALDPGLCELLRGEVELEAAIQPTQVDGLMLVAGGQCDYQSIAALAKDSLKAVLHKAREQFDFIVIDAAPVLAYADTLLMGAQVDAAVLSVRRDVSQLQKVYEARERLESVGIRVLGAVVNGITETSRRPAYALPSPV